MSGNETGIWENLVVYAKDTWALSLRPSPFSPTLGNDEMPADIAPQSWADLRLDESEGIAGSMRDGHMDGFFNTPPTLGEIKDNILYGGGLAPVEWLHGPRTVTYVYYVGASTTEEVLRIVNRHKFVWSYGPLAVTNHRMGWLTNGYLAAPLAVEWLTGDHEAVVKITATVVFSDPYITPLDARHERITYDRFNYEEMFKGLVNEDAGYADIQGWNANTSHDPAYLNFDFTSEFDRATQPTFAFIGVKKPQGQAADATLAFSISRVDEDDSGGVVDYGTFYMDTGRTYAAGIGIIDGANPNVVYRTNDTFYPATWKDGKVPPPDFFKVSNGQRGNFYVAPANNVFPNAITNLEAGMVLYTRKV